MLHIDESPAAGADRPPPRDEEADAARRVREVLVCVEPGPGGARAVALGVALARRHGAHLTLAEQRAQFPSSGLLPLSLAPSPALGRLASWAQTQVGALSVCSAPSWPPSRRFDVVVVGPSHADASASGEAVLVVR